jgi:5-methylcytosine-specific restriction endonuclease McrA
MNYLMKYKQVRARLRRVRERDGDLCWLCLGRVPRRSRGGHRPTDQTIDHVVPRSKGGEDDDDNLRLAHRSCNHDRRDADPPPEVHGRWAAWQAWRAAFAKRTRKEAAALDAFLDDQRARASWDEPGEPPDRAG